MTPKEKAIELYNKFLNPSGDTYLYGILEHESAKECALIAVDEILQLKETQDEYQIQYDNGEWSREIGYRYSKYWTEVKKEIENL